MHASCEILSLTLRSLLNKGVLGVQTRRLWSQETSFEPQLKDESLRSSQTVGDMNTEELADWTHSPLKELRMHHIKPHGDTSSPYQNLQQNFEHWWRSLAPMQ